jgi:uncharacterized protein
MEIGHPALGSLVETFVFIELIKLRAFTTCGFRLYHYRDRDAREIDFVCEGPGRRVRTRWQRDRVLLRFAEPADPS